MCAPPIFSYRALLIAATAVALAFGATAPAEATLSPDQGTYTQESPPPLIVKAPEVPPQTQQEQLLPVSPAPPGAVAVAQVTPEPGALLMGLLGAGLAGWAGLRRRWRGPAGEPPAEDLAGDAEA